jgi:hypothetical protein
MEKAIKNLASRLGAQQFDLAKSSHAVSICFYKTEATRHVTQYIFLLCYNLFWFYNVFKTIITGKCNENPGKGRTYNLGGFPSLMKVKL